VLNESSAVGSVTAALQHTDTGRKQLERGFVKDWLGLRFVRSNFIPKFTLLSTAGWTIASSTGGSLTNSTTYYWKITRKNLARGFEEDISAETTTATAGGGTAISFTAPATAGYVYNVYFGVATGNSNLYLVKENLAASGVYLATSTSASGTNAPATPASGVTVHPIYIFAADSIDGVKLDGYAMEGMITPKGASDSDPLAQRRKVGSKWANKAGIRDATRIKRIELASNF
jgi:hypothetical protein